MKIALLILIAVSLAACATAQQSSITTLTAAPTVTSNGVTHFVVQPAPFIKVRGIPPGQLRKLGQGWR